MVVLEKIDILNYRSCHDVSITLQDGLSVLIGPNGSGKTTVMNACLLLNRLAEDDSYLRGRPVDELTDESRIVATFRIDGRRARLTADIQLTADESNRDVVTSSTQKWFARDFTGNGVRIHAPLFLPRFFRWSDIEMPVITSGRFFPGQSRAVSIPRSFFKPFREITKALATMQYYSAARFTDPSRCPVSIETVQRDNVRRVRGTRNKNPHELFIFDLYDVWKEKHKSTYQTFFSTIGPDGLGLVDDLKFQEIETSSVEYTVRTGGKFRTKTQQKKLVIPQFTIGENQLSPSQLSEGTFKTLALLFYVMTGVDSLLLIEEPEVCIHHGLLSSVIELIRSYSQDKQILVSTHSDAVLDMLEPKQVYMVKKNNDQRTSVTHVERGLSTEDLRALKKYLSSEGGLGEYWKHGGLE